MTDLAIVTYDADTGARLSGAVIELNAPGWIARFLTTDSVGRVLFRDVAWTDMPAYPYLKASKSEYLSQQISIYSGQLLVEIRLKKEYVPPPPPPLPLPPGEEFVRREGSYCSLTRKYMFGSMFYYLRHDSQGALTAYDSSWENIERHVKDFPQCVTAPPPPSIPPSDEALAALTKNESAATQALINTTSGMQMQGLNVISAKQDGILDIISKTVVGGLNDISTWLGSLTNATNTIAASQAASRIENREGFGDLLAWTKDFKVPEPSKFIIDSVNGLLQPARDVLAWTQNFKFPDWNAAIVQPVSRMLDEKLSAMFQIDVAKPFWNELEKKIITLSTKIMASAFDSMKLDEEYWKKKKE